MKLFIRFFISFLSINAVQDLLIEIAAMLARNTNTKFDDMAVRDIRNILDRYRG